MTATPEEPVRFAAVGLDHSHIFGQIAGLVAAGCTLVGVSSQDPDAPVAQEVRRRWPDAPWVDDIHQLLADPTVELVTTAAIPDQRAAIAIEAMRHGKDVVTDKPGCISLDELDSIAAGGQRNGPVLVGVLLRTLRGALGHPRRRTGPGGPDRPGHPDHRARAAPGG